MRVSRFPRCLGSFWRYLLLMPALQRTLSLHPHCAMLSLKPLLQFSYEIWGRQNSFGRSRNNGLVQNLSLDLEWHQHSFLLPSDLEQSLSFVWYCYPVYICGFSQLTSTLSGKDMISWHRCDTVYNGEEQSGRCKMSKWSSTMDWLSRFTYKWRININHDSYK